MRPAVPIWNPEFIERDVIWRAVLAGHGARRGGRDLGQSASVLVFRRYYYISEPATKTM
jgi:hypothetical protein